MDTIYLTVSQIEALAQLVADGKTLTGVQLESDANARTNVLCTAVRLRSDIWENENALIEPDGVTPGWER